MNKSDKDKYYDVVTKFDNTRACLARTYEALTGEIPRAPANWTGTWHDWLIKEIDQIIKERGLWQSSS